MLPGDAPGYRVLDQAGEGGFAVVYRAHQERLDRIVALKVLSVDRVDQRTMRRFQRELQLTGRLTGHPNVVTVFDTGVTRSGKPYIAMDFFENGTLRDKLRNEGPLPVPDVLRMGVKLAGALAAVHEAGVLHGDIKPQNILISRYGEPAVADFGVARVVDAAEISATSHAFTPLHAAPEVLTGQPHSVSTDIYSLGSTLYHLLAGQPAFHSPTDPSIAPLMYRILSNVPPPINRADVPPVVTESILRALAKQPDQRYGSARAFAQRLQQVQAELGLPVTDLIGQELTPGRPVSGPGVPAAPRTPPTHPGRPLPTNLHVPPGGMPVSSPAPYTGANLYAPPAEMPVPSPTTPPYAGPTQASSASPPVDAGYGRLTTNPGGRAPGLKTRLVIGVAVASVVVVGTVLAVSLSRQQAGRSVADPPTGAPSASQRATADQAPAGIGKQQVAALAPRRVRVTADQGTLVELSWTLPAGARRYPVVVQRSPVEPGGQALTPLEAGTTSARLSGLAPDTGYCFVVGVPLDIGENSTVAWSKPACVRGAVPKKSG